MDIGTAKPSLEDQAAIPHHLINIADPPDAFSVSQYRVAALKTIDEIRHSDRCFMCPRDFKKFAGSQFTHSET